MPLESRRPAGRAPDPYRLLQVSPNASDEVIRAAYRALARRSHPDVSPTGDAGGRRMQALNAAYALLSDPARRADYDAQHRRAVVRVPTDVRTERRVEVRRTTRPSAVMVGITLVVITVILSILAVSAVIEGLDEPVYAPVIGLTDEAAPQPLLNSR